MEEVAKNSHMLQSSWKTPRDMSTSEVGQSPRDTSDKCYRCGKPQDTGLPNANCTMHEWNFDSRRTPSIQDYLQSLENTLLHYLLPALMEPSAISPLERKFQFILGYSLSLILFLALIRSALRFLKGYCSSQGHSRCQVIGDVQVASAEPHGD